MNNYDYMERRLTEISYELQAMLAMYPDYHTIEVSNHGVNIHGDYENGESFMITATNYRRGTYTGVMTDPRCRREFDVDNHLKEEVVE